MELTVVTVIKEAQAMFMPAAEKEDEEFHDCADAPPSKLSSKRTGTDPTASEVEALLQILIEAYPSFTQDKALENARFPPRAITAIMAKVRL